MNGYAIESSQHDNSDRGRRFEKRSGSGEVAFAYVQSGALIQCDRQNAERAGLPGELDV